MNVDTDFKDFEMLEISGIIEQLEQVSIYNSRS
jgi:hypothetical protein